MVCISRRKCSNSRAIRRSFLSYSAFADKNLGANVNIREQWGLSSIANIFRWCFTLRESLTSTHGRQRRISACLILAACTRSISQREHNQVTQVVQDVTGSFEARKR
jgi:hypothetical protein